MQYEDTFTPIVTSGKNFHELLDVMDRGNSEYPIARSHFPRFPNFQDCRTSPDYDFAFATDNRHMQAWARIPSPTDDKLYFMGAHSYLSGGYIYVIEKENMTDPGCMVWKKRLNNPYDEWGYFSHPSHFENVGFGTSNTIVALTANCYPNLSEGCDDESNSGVIFMDVSNPHNPTFISKFETQLPKQPNEPDMTTFAKIGDKYVMAVINAKSAGYYQEGDVKRTVWTYSSDTFNEDDPASSFLNAPVATQIGAIGLDASSGEAIQNCKYIANSAHANGDTYLICTYGDREPGTADNYFWGKRVETSGANIGQPTTGTARADYLDIESGTPNGRIGFNELSLPYLCVFRAGASLYVNKAGELEVHCAGWEYSESGVGVTAITSAN